MVKDDKDVKAIPLGNNILSKKLHEMSEDIEIQLVEKLKTKIFQRKLMNQL